MKIKLSMSGKSMELALLEPWGYWAVQTNEAFSLHQKSDV